MSGNGFKKIPVFVGLGVRNVAVLARSTYMTLQRTHHSKFGHVVLDVMAGVAS